MITGFNTDIEHDGVVYHVQTEDKGLETPIILSLVYVGGAILASKRAPYEDLIAEGFSDEVLAERLKRQHRLICAAINSGRINDLKKMSARAEEIAATVAVPAEPETPAEITVAPEPPQEVVQEIEAPAPEVDTFEFVLEEDIPSQIWTPPEKVEPPPPPPEPEVIEPAEPEFAQDQEYTFEETHTHPDFRDAVPEEGLSLLLLDDNEFNSGESRTLRVLVLNRKGANEKPLSSVAVSIKILGTTFRPLIYSLKTDRDGVASVTTQIPQFTSGRAAVLVRAFAKDQAAELRRIIHPGR